MYTGKGDRGDTGRLGTRARLSKSSELIEAIGALDEATCAIGAARALIPESRIAAWLRQVQQHFVALMGHISATPEHRTRFGGVTEAEVRWLEEIIAVLDAELPPLRDFVLPGASPAEAALHVARATVRRAERRVVALSEVEAGIAPAALAYLNRLSSFLFAVARITLTNGGNK